MNTEDLSTDLSLDALLGIRSQPEDRPEPEEIRDQPRAPSVDLLSMLGLAPAEEAVREEAPSEPAVAAEAFDDLRALLGLRGDPAPVADDAEAAPEMPAEPTPVAPPIRSRFADAPAFRQDEPREEPVAVEKPVATSGPSEPEEPVSPEESVAAEESVAPEAPPAPDAQPMRNDAPEQPAMPVTPAVRFLAGERGLPGLPRRSQVRDAAAVCEPEPPQPSKPDRSEQRSQPAKPRPSAQQPKPEGASAADPAPRSASPAAASRVPSPAAAVSRPLGTERKPEPPKRSNGLWYLMSACLFALALACTCYAVYVAAHDNASASPAPLSSSTPAEAGEQRFRYTVQSEDGTTRSVVETVRFDVDAFAAESTVNLEAKSESEAVSLLEAAQERFGDAWVSGSVVDGTAVFTVKHEGELDRAAYEALVEAIATDCVPEK